jgi:16S rRNA (cytosine967-C5)-methyltransferase
MSGEHGFELRIAKQALLEGLVAGRPTDRALQDAFRENRAGAQQRGLVADIVYKAVRFWPLLVELPARPQNPAWMREFQEALASLVNLSTDELLRRHEKAKPSFGADPLGHLRRLHGVPEFLLHEMAQTPVEWHEYLHASFFCEAPVTVRMNPLRTTAAEFERTYARFSPERIPYLPDAYRFRKRWPMFQDEGFQAGHFEIQDEHSQLVAWLIDPKPGEAILDMCAGGGGKTLHLATLLGGKGEVLAYDLSKKRLQDLVTRARRASLTNIRTLDSLGSAGKFDVVLVDAPCSGLGTLRRGPDRLYALTQEECRKLSSIQAEIFRSARDRLKPGGRLVYVTCTVRPAENATIVKAGIEGSALKLVDPRARLRTRLPGCDEFLAAADVSPAGRILRAYKGTESFFQVGPAASLSQTSGAGAGDGFFYALVQ